MTLFGFWNFGKKYWKHSNLTTKVTLFINSIDNEVLLQFVWLRHFTSVRKCPNQNQKQNQKEIIKTSTNTVEPD